MAQLALIADDLTGALDTSVCLLPADVLVRTDADASAIADAEVVAFNAATRHLGADDAARVVSGLAVAARMAGVTCVLKKTDSALRGNVGAELAAVRAATGAARLHFIPALPEMGRVTVGGVHYVDGVPVSESCFGREPFEPVRESRVGRVLAAQTDVPVRVVAENDPAPCDFEGIVAYDATSSESVDRRVRELADAGELGCVAGCSGIAQALAGVLGLTASPRVRPETGEGNLLVVCGSVNRVSVRQCAFARLAGAFVRSLPLDAKFDPSWVDGPAGTRLVTEVARGWATSPLTVVDGSSREMPAAVRAAGEGAVERARGLVSGNIGEIVSRVCRVATGGRLLVTGGDVLASFLARADARELRPVGQLARGIVGFDLELPGGHALVAAKSGGFGPENLFVDMAGLPAPSEVECL